MSTIKYRKLSPDGDYVFGFGNTDFLEDIEAVRQAIETKLKMFRNEFWEDLDDGLPFFQQMAGSYDKDVIDMVIRSRILETPYVIGVKSFESKITPTRKYIASVSADTAFGTVSVGVNL